VSSDPVLEPRLGDGPDHLAACHLPMAEGENLADFRPAIGEAERVVEPDGALSPDAALGAGVAGQGPISPEGGKA
jgi:hypothetical protein